MCNQHYIAHNVCKNAEQNHKKKLEKALWFKRQNFAIDIKDKFSGS